MHPPCEMMVEAFLPAMRQRIAKKLSAEGLSQGKIAKLLDITQASVSLYLRDSSSTSSLLSRRLGLSDEEVDMYASLLAEDLKRSPVYALSTLYSLWAALLGRGEMCGPHRADHPLLQTCELCPRVFGSGANEKGSFDAIEHVSQAVRLIEGSRLFVYVMPQVSVNIAYAGRTPASTIRDIVAIPGRIVKVKDRARSFMKPEYGASTSVANVLLAVMAGSPRIRAAMNIRFDDKMRRVLQDMELNILEVSRTAGMDETEFNNAVAGKVGQARDGLHAIVDGGGPGIEPGVYLLAEDAVRAAELGILVARAYSSAT